MRKLTTSPIWALAVVAALGMGLSGCSSSDSGPTQAELDAANAAAAAAAAAEAAAKAAAEEAAAQAEADKQAAVEAERMRIMAEQQKMAVMDAVAAASASVMALMGDSSDVDVAGAEADIASAMAAIAAASTFSAADMAMYNAQVAAIQAGLTLAQANIRAYRAEMERDQAQMQATAAERAKQAVEDAIMALTAAETAQNLSEVGLANARTALSDAQMAVTNAADNDALTAASAALASALMQVSTASADYAVKAQAVAVATTALSMARDDLAEADPDHVALQEANEKLAQAMTDAEAQADRIKALEDQIAALQKAEADRQQAAEDEAEEERMMQMAANGKALHKALTSNPLGFLDDDGAITLSATGLAVNPNGTGDDGDADGLASVTLEAGDSAGTVGNWDGMHYVNTDPGTKVLNHAVVYTNRDDPDMVAFGTVHVDTLDTVTSYSATDRRLTLTAAQANSNIKGARFPTAGTTTYSADADGGTDVSFSGEYDGVPGTYLCTTAGTPGCSAAYGADGITLTGTWTFTHSAGAMVAQADPNYLFFGWWLRKDGEGVPSHASAFRGVVGDVDGTGTPPNLTEISGSASYAGKAAGKFAIYNPLDSTGDAGHFTADAMLTATFGDGDGAGVTGTINNFMANEKSVPWSVALGLATLTDDTTGAFASRADDAATTDVDETTMPVWSIDGNAADAAGTWSGVMYDEDADDGSNVPTTAIGTFQTEFGSIGRMVGGFGAEKQ